MQNPSVAATDLEGKKALIQVALGTAHADLMVRNGRVLNVYTGEILDRWAVAVKGDAIAYVGADADHGVGPQTRIVDADGQTVIPGLIDGHTHLAWLFTTAAFLTHAITGGTTTFVTETMEPYPVAGLAGVEDFLASLADQPVKILATAPAMMSISRAARGISEHDLDRLLKRPDILGLGESYWQSILQETDRMLPMYRQTLAAGKCLEGHSAGASEKKLMAYLASGVSSCHEPITAGEVLDRIRLGLHVMIREGSIRRDLSAIARIRETGVGTRRLILATDGVDPGDLLEKGCMEYVVQKAIDCGFDPVAAIQMATLNVAEHFSLDGWIGGIAPGRQADLVIVPDPRTIRASMVISKGCIIARDGKPLAEPRTHDWTPASRTTVNLPAPLQASDFSIRVPDRTVATITARVMDLVTELVTREVLLQLPVTAGEILADPAGGLLKVAAIDRTHRPGHRFTGLIRGFGLTRGAVASSAAWDTTDIIVVGAGEDDMAAAVNRIHQLQGGVTAAIDGRIVAELPLPIFGLMSELPMVPLRDQLNRLRRTIREMGFPHPDPLLTLITLTGQAIPFLRICEEGLVNFKDGVTRQLLAEIPD